MLAPVTAADRLLQAVDVADEVDVEIATAALYCECGLDRDEPPPADDGEHDETCPASYRDEVARLLTAVRREGVRP